MYQSQSRWVSALKDPKKPSKNFFFEKKKQKTFGSLNRTGETPMAQSQKSFLVTFFQKSNRFLPP